MKLNSKPGAGHWPVLSLTRGNTELLLRFTPSMVFQAQPGTGAVLWVVTLGMMQHQPSQADGGDRKGEKKRAARGSFPFQGRSTPAATHQGPEALKVTSPGCDTPPME
ncbi:hypothetical protein EYF80_055102 [Liparis tanakae]|uniref:Uncharacterized protein n=1 Tax=Liparis tanakae TaxID=230148 RepID=A0A4Z2F2K8_9TELE|nr:hypothetical protein EYF80_055102 [Liparis tanakae]